MNFQEKLAGVVNRYDEVQSLLSSQGISADELVKLNKEISTLEPIVEVINHYQKQLQSFNDASEMMEDSSLDKEMRELAEIEYYEDLRIRAEKGDKEAQKEYDAYLAEQALKEQIEEEKSKTR